MVAAVKLTKLAAVKLDDANAERARDSHATAIGELQNLPAVGMIALGEFTIGHQKSITVNHRLGRRPVMVYVSPPRIVAGITAGGNVFEIVGAVDRTQQIQLYADGFTVPVTVTVVVM